MDLRGTDIGPDQLESLRLAGPEDRSIEKDGFSVSETVQNGSLLTLRVAEFADVADPHLWMLKQPPTFLVEALRDGIAGLGEHPLAAALAARAIGGTPAHEPDPPGFHPAQADAYRACLGEGVHLVWGPPGTGKTTVLKRAIGDLIARGERVLLVSATNVAVDNALLGVVREKRHGQGEIVRVGPPHLKEVAEDASVSLPLMVRARLAETAERRSAVEAALVSIRNRAGQLAALESTLAGFDASAYFAALKLLRTPGQDLASALARSDAADDRYAQAVRAAAAATATARTASDRSEAAEHSRELWQEVELLSEEAVRVRQAAEHREADALLAGEECRPLRHHVKQWESKGSMARWRAREKIAALQEQLADAERRAETAREESLNARRTATARISLLDARITALSDSAPSTGNRSGTSTLKPEPRGLLASRHNGFVPQPSRRRTGPTRRPSQRSRRRRSPTGPPRRTGRHSTTGQNNYVRSLPLTAPAGRNWNSGTKTFRKSTSAWPATPRARSSRARSWLPPRWPASAPIALCSRAPTTLCWSTRPVRQPSPKCS